MKKPVLIILALVTLLAACTPYMYGVPQESWDRMSETERIEAMRIYERNEQARRQAAEERARSRAIEEQARRQAAEERARREELAREQERARQVAAERLQRERIEAIHRGEGAYGELIRVRLQGGRIRIGGRTYRYEPLTFTIAANETRKISVTDSSGRETALLFTYAGGALAFENIRLPYDRSWGRGRLFSNTATSGAVELRGVDVSVEVHDRSARFEREASRLIAIPEEPLPPPRMEVKERELPKPPPVAVHERETPKPPPPGRQPSLPIAEHAPRLVEIVLLAGELKVRNERVPLERVSLRIAEGESREMWVKAGGEKVVINLLYRNGQLTFDGPSRNGRDTARFAFERDWKKGKVYRFDLKGRVSLDRLEVRVTGIEER